MTFHSCKVAPLRALRGGGILKRRIMSHISGRRFIILFAVLLFSVSTLFAHAWTGPTQAPPNGNVSAPVNVGTTNQVKNASLSVNGLAVFGNSLLSGTSRYLNFGTLSGTTGYGIRDNAGVMEVKSNGGAWLGILSGSGTTNYLPKLTAARTVGNSQIFDNGTNVGIGTTSPSQKLHVNGAVQATSFLYSSDERLKRDIRPLDAWRGVMEIEPRQFVWNDSGASDIGVLAQEVEKLFPELVSIGANGYRSVDYAKLVVPLLGVVRDQQDQIEKLKARLDAAGI